RVATRSKLSSARLSVVFTPCPPGPEEREKRQRSSSSGMTIEPVTANGPSMTSSSPREKCESIPELCLLYADYWRNSLSGQTFYYLYLTCPRLIVCMRQCVTSGSVKALSIAVEDDNTHGAAACT